MAGYRQNDDFICGVVEGFYGRPWTTEQRKDLFQKMRKWGMDSYLYAPKDDYKHRACWRELYTVEEADHLSALIASAKENNIRFIYAISPGLDIIYSSAKDLLALRRKLEQVNQLGSEALAILFDDIEPEMTKADKDVFQSFAHAQVSVTNETFQNLNVNKFLFCPTQYCASRAVPNVSNSEYLKTIGSKLDLGVDIMWTGPRVISKDITIESVEEITEVLRRKIILWDNLHANDYDQKRIFLGPYSGRSPQLIPRLKGVLTNPNCEPNCNFIAVYTLAHWSQCSVDAKKKMEESMNPDIKLETENEENHIPENLDPHIYHPLAALKMALEEWIHEFKRPKSVWGPIVKPQIIPNSFPSLPPVSVPTCLSLASTSTSIHSSDTMAPPLPPFITSALLTTETKRLVPCDTLPVVPTMMNSLVSANKIICGASARAVSSTNLDLPSSNNSSIEEDNMRKFLKPSESDYLPSVLTSPGLEPMEIATPPNSSPPRTNAGPERASSEDMLVDSHTADNSERVSGMSSPVDSNASVSVMNLDTEVEGNGPSSSTASANNSSTMLHETNSDNLETEDDELTVEDLHFIADLFYLPFDHGLKGLEILKDFHWLKANSNHVAGVEEKDKERPEIAEWYERAKKFEEFSTSINRIVGRLNMIPNRELLYELYPYIWDMRGVISLLNSYIKWLALGLFSPNVTSFIHGSYTWFSKGWRDSFCSGDQEPWIIRGGLTAELQRLIPVDRGTDLYVYKAPDIPTSQFYTIRPYRPEDEGPVYKLCLETFKDGMDASLDFVSCPKLPGDINIGPFLAQEIDFNFVIEDENDTVFGIAVGVKNGKEFRKKTYESWIKSLRIKYPMNNSSLEHMKYAKSAVEYVHKDISPLPDEITLNHPAEIRIYILASHSDQSTPKRLMTCILAAFRANGIFGCYVEVPKSEDYTCEFYKKLGFTELQPNFMGRSF